MRIEEREKVLGFGEESDEDGWPDGGGRMGEQIDGLLVGWNLGS